MQLVYLPNGQQCHLKEIIGERYLIKRIFEFEDHEGNWHDFEREEEEIVSQIFFNKPIAKIDEEIKNLTTLKEVKEKELGKIKDEINSARFELNKITNTTIEAKKLIINKTDLMNATTLALFPKDKIMPLTMNNKNTRLNRLKLSMEIEINSYGEDRYWGYKLDDEDHWTNSQFLEKNNGILINPTEEEIEERIKQRLTEKEWSSHNLVEVPDHLLSANDLKLKKNYILNNHQNSINQAKKQMENYQKEVARLEQQLKEI